jgi:hypothetical protein
MVNLKNVRTKSRRLGTTSHKKPSLNICIRLVIFIHCAFIFASNEKSIISRLDYFFVERINNRLEYYSMDVLCKGTRPSLLRD